MLRRRLRSQNTKNFLLNAKRGSGKVWFVKYESTEKGDRVGCVSNMNITRMQIRLGCATPRLLVWGRTEGGVGSLWLRPQEIEQPRPFAVSARETGYYYTYNNERNGEWESFFWICVKVLLIRSLTEILIMFHLSIQFVWNVRISVVKTVAFSIENTNVIGLILKECIHCIKLGKATIYIMQCKLLWTNFQMHKCKFLHNMRDMRNETAHRNESSSISIYSI